MPDEGLPSILHLAGEPQCAGWDLIGLHSVTPRSLGTLVHHVGSAEGLPRVPHTLGEPVRDTQDQLMHA